MKTRNTTDQARLDAREAAKMEMARRWFAQATTKDERLSLLETWGPGVAR